MMRIWPGLLRAIRLTVVSLLVASAGTGRTAAATDSPAILIDGRFEDWGITTPPIADASATNGVPRLLRVVRTRMDENCLYVLIDVGTPLNAQRIDGTVSMLLNVDSDATTGGTVQDARGIDLTVELTPPNPREPDRRGMGIGVTAVADTLDDAPPMVRYSPYDADVRFAPTLASRYFEFALPRAVHLDRSPPLWLGDGTTIVLMYAPPGESATTHSRPATHDTGIATDRPDLPAAPTLDAPTGTVRIANWNIQRDGMFERPGNIQRVLAALDPDVLLLQEVGADRDAADVSAWLNAHLRDDDDDDRPWQAVVTTSSEPDARTLRCAVAVRDPLTIEDAMTDIDMPALGGDARPYDVRAVVATIEHAGRRMIATSLHLRCCGGAGGPEDATRQAELRAVARVMRRFTNQQGMPVEGVVIGGDFNLVGSGHLLPTFARSLDTDGSTLAVADAYRINRRTNATWADRDQPFAPGRLDFVLYGDAGLTAQQAFVFCTSDLDSQQLRRRGLHCADSPLASDHRPVVVDLHWRQ